MLAVGSRPLIVESLLRPASAGKTFPRSRPFSARLHCGDWLAERRGMDVAQWLQDLGLPGYAALFREQAIDADVLPSLTDADFEKLGLPLGHRKKLLRAIAALETAPPATPSIPRPPHAAPPQLTVM